MVFRRFANIGIFAKCLKQVEKKSVFGDFYDLGDVVEIVYLLIDLFTIFDAADVETPVFLAISAMGIPYPEKSLIVIRNRTLAYYNVYMIGH